MDNQAKQKQHRATIKDRGIVYLNTEVPARIRDKLREIAASKEISLNKLVLDALKEIINAQED
jgi:hypothetical protein